MSEDFREATRRFRRRVAPRHAAVRRTYLTPELRDEAEHMRTMLDQCIARLVKPRVLRRVARIRDGEAVEETRRRRTPQT